jgi:hypothetical protein
MVTPELLAFVRDEDAKGTPRNAIRSMLLTHGGWNLSNIEEAFAQVPSPNVPSIPATPNPVPMSATFGPQAVASGTPTPTLVTAPVKKSGPPILAVVAVLIILLGVGVGAAYAFIPAIHSGIAYTVAGPTDRVLLSLQQLREAKNFTYDTTTKTTVTGGTTTDPRIASLLQASGTSGSFSGVIAHTGNDTLHFPDAVSGALTLRLGASIDLSADLYAAPDILALRLTKPLNFIFFTTDPITGKWVNLLDTGSSKGTPILNPEELATYTKYYGAYRQTLAYLAAHIEDYVNATATGETKQIGGETAHGFDITLNKVQFAGTMKSSPFMVLITDPKLKAELTASFDAFATSTDPMTATLWIGDTSHYPLESDASFTQSSTLTGFGTITKTTDFSATFSKFGSSVVADRPTDFITVGQATDLVTASISELFKKPK